MDRQEDGEHDYQLLDDEQDADNDGGESDDEEDPISSDEVEPIATSRWDLFVKSVNHNFMPDTPWEYRGSPILDLIGVKFCKFFVWTTLMMIVMHWLVKALDWERDENYTIHDFVLYHLNLVALDIFVFFGVGRLFRQRGIDDLAWLLLASIAAFYMSWATNFAFMRYSVSLYDMHCHWPWKLWVFAIVLTPLCCIIVWWHIKYAIQKGVILQKIVEVIISLILFIIPYISNPNFHLHHWYFGWLVGMHANFDVWWSRATMAYLWGFYVNGIAVYGRDPLLTCAFSYFQSIDQECPYMSCNVDPNSTTMSFFTDPDHYKPMPKPNWLNCSGYTP